MTKKKKKIEAFWLAPNILLVIPVPVFALIYKNGKRGMQEFPCDLELILCAFSSVSLCFVSKESEVSALRLAGAFLSVAWPNVVQLLVFFCSSVPVM